MRGLGVASVVLLLVPVLSACSDDANESATSSDQTQALCDALKAFREEAFADLGEGVPADSAEFNASVGDFYLSLREFAPKPIQGDLEVVAGAARGEVQEPTAEQMDAGVRVGNYFQEQCGDELPIN